MTSQLRVLVACEFSGVVRDAFRRHGCFALSCDLDPDPNDSPFHIRGDVLPWLKCRWDLVIAHPPCTYLCNSGVRWLFPQDGRPGEHLLRRMAMEQACEFFNQFKEIASFVCIENPIPHGSAKDRIGSYTQLIQPWMFGHRESKATCLWLHNLPCLTPSDMVGPPPKVMTKEEKASWNRVHRMARTKDRGKLRSITFQGIADAMADQWVPYMKAAYDSGLIRRAVSDVCETAPQ